MFATSKIYVALNSLVIRCQVPNVRYLGLVVVCRKIAFIAHGNAHNCSITRDFVMKKEQNILLSHAWSVSAHLGISLCLNSFLCSYLDNTANFVTLINRPGAS